MKKALCAALLLIIACAFIAGCAPQGLQVKKANSIKNVIIIIGDGMGFNHIANASTYFGEKLFDFGSNFVCGAETRSNDNETTDSAAAATALATGNKTDNKSVGRLDGVDFENIMSVAQRYGKKTGIVTSDYLYGATPAGFSSHADARSDYETIVSGQAASGVDLFVGKKDTKGYYDGKTALFEENGYKFVSNCDELYATAHDQKVVANISRLRSTYNETLKQQNDFNGIIGYALDYLDNKNGFCLMIENAYVDKCSHDNDVYGAMCEVKYLNDTINTVLKFCENRNDTAVLVTADHETGGLQLAENREQITNELYTKTGHSSANVPFYLFGCELINPNETIDNTDVFKISKYLITKGKE